MPAESPVFEEAPSYRGEIRSHFPMEAGQYHNAFSGGLGWALPAAVGAALADPGRRTVCLIGDGSFMYSVQALWTAARHRLPLTVVVLDNAEYGSMKAFTTLFGIDAFPGPIQTAFNLPPSTSRPSPPAWACRPYAPTIPRASRPPSAPP